MCSLPLFLPHTGACWPPMGARTRRFWSAPLASTTPRWPATSARCWASPPGGRPHSPRRCTCEHVQLVLRISHRRGMKSGSPAASACKGMLQSASMDRQRQGPLPEMFFGGGYGLLEGRRFAVWLMSHELHGKNFRGGLNPKTPPLATCRLEATQKPGTTVEACI